MTTGAAEERTDQNNTGDAMGVLQIAINTVLPDDRDGEFDVTPSVAPNAEVQASVNEACEAEMVPLPDDNADDFPSLPPVATGTVVSVKGVCDPAMMPLPKENALDLPETVSTPAQNADEPSEENTGGVPPKQSAEPVVENPVSPTSPQEEPEKNPEPGPVSELELAVATPLPDDTPELSFERIASLKSIEEVKTVFTDIYTQHYLAYKRDGTVYGAMLPNQMMATRNAKTGEVSGILVDCDLLHTDPILCELRSIEDTPDENHVAMDYKPRWKSVSNLKKPKYYRHDAESIFYIWLAHASQLKLSSDRYPPYYYSNIPPTCKQNWFWNLGDTLNRLSRGSKVVEETWTSLWKLVGEAHFSSRTTPKDETLYGHFTPEKFLEAIGVDAETLASTVGDEESLKDYLSDSD